MSTTIDVWTVVLGAIILGITNKIIEYYWETHGKARLKRIDQLIFKHSVEEQIKQNAAHKELAKRIDGLQSQIDKLKNGKEAKNERIQNLQPTNDQGSS